MSDDLDSSDGSANCPAPSSDEVHALRERAEQLGATAEELEAALERLALHAEVVLRRLRGEAVH